MSVALYGGTFNPPHIGHYSVVKTISPLFDRVVIMPSATPPHKTLPFGSPSDRQRFEMARLTFRGFANVEVSDFEVNKGGACRTADTIKQFENVTLVIGTDMLKCFEQWARFEEIFRNAEIAAVQRDGEPLDTHAERLCELYGARIRIIAHKPIDVSSSLIRNSFQGREKALEMISVNRLEHSLATELEAVRLAAHWREDTAAAGWAALLHDCTKHWTTERHLQLCEKHSIIIDNAFAKSPKLLHSVTASIVAEREFNAPPHIVKAISNHTTGRGDMSPLEKIIYIADKIEPVRNYSGVEHCRELAYQDLNRAMLEMLNRNIYKLESERKPIHQNTLIARDYYYKKCFS